MFPKVVNGRLVRLYIVPNQRSPEGIPLSTTFEPRTRYEIGDIQWIALSHINHKSCYNAWLFLPDIEAFVNTIKSQREATKSQQEANLMGNNSSKPWHKKKMFDTEGESSGELDNRAANYDEENLVAEKNKKRSNRDRKEPKNLVSKSSRSNEVNPEFNIDQKEELSYVQNNQLGASLSDDFIPAAWQSFNLDHKHLLDLALNRI